MINYLMIDNEGNVEGYATLHGRVDVSNYIELSPNENPEDFLNKRLTNNEFVVKVEPILDIVIDKEDVKKGEIVNINIEVKNKNDNIVIDITNKYLVPIFDIDGRKERILQVDIENGIGQVNLSFNEDGIYTIETSKIRSMLGPMLGSKMINKKEIKVIG